jgi:hypothetical protein
MTVRNGSNSSSIPGSVAVVAEPAEPGCYADVVLRNLAAAALGPILPVPGEEAFAVRHRRPHAHFGTGKPCPTWPIVCAPLRDVAGSSPNWANAARAR